MAAEPITTETSVPWRTDGTRYTCPDFLGQERAKVFQRAWLVAGTSGQVRTPGSYFTTKILDKSLIIMRGGDGQLRAFHNSCLHRGTRMLDGSGHTDCVRCPYHGWKYALDGKLLDIPGRDGIHIGVDESKLKLHEVHAAEAIGLIWINFERAPEDLVASLHSIPEELAPYHLEEMVPVQERTWELDCNWKAVLDNATESYHLSIVHPWSVDDHVTERPDFRTYGDHTRLTLAIAPYGWRRFADKFTTRGGPYTERQMDALQKFVLFPNTLINVLPYHLTIFQVWPTAADRCTFFYGFYGRKGGWPLEWLRVRASWLFSRWVLYEDMRVMDHFQHGVGNERVHTHWFHESEIAIAHHQATLTRWIEAPSHPMD